MSDDNRLDICPMYKIGDYCRTTRSIRLSVPVDCYAPFQILRLVIIYSTWPSVIANAGATDAVSFTESHIYISIKGFEPAQTFYINWHLILFFPAHKSIRSCSHTKIYNRESKKMKVGNPLIGAALALLLVLATAQDDSVSPLLNLILVNRWSII